MFKTMFDEVFGKDWEKFNTEVENFIHDAYKEVQVPSFILSKGSYPKVNVTENTAGFKIVAAVPGLKREDLEITYKDGFLSVIGKSQNVDLNSDDKFVLRELKKSSFMRSFRIDHETIDVNSIKCSLENGELTVTLSKKNKTDTSEGIKIKID